MTADPRDSNVLDCPDCAELYEVADGHDCPASWPVAA